MRLLRALGCGLGLLAATSASAQGTHVLIITGLGGEPQYRAAFQAEAALLADSARAKWHVADSSLIVLGEDVALDRAHIQATSTRENVASAFLRLSKRVQPGDLLLVFLNGHGGGEGAASRVNLPGPDPTAADFATWLSGFSKQSIVFVNAASGSGDFLPVLAKPGRVIVTATKTAFEHNETIFAQPFVRGLVGGDADADKDGRISVLEAFDYAKKEVARRYDSDRKMQTEHAQLSDSALARSISFGGQATSVDPRVIALSSERRQLELAVAALRARKASTDSTAYANELERLLIAIAEKSQAIRAAGGKP